MKHFIVVISLMLSVALLPSAPAQATTCGKTPAGTFNGKAVWKADSGVGFKSAGLAVDADGAPNSYQVDGNGLSFTCDGVTAIGSTPDTDPKHWQEKCRAGWARARATGDYSKLSIFGFQTDTRNTPLVQKVGDPLPDIGFISTTSVPVSDGPSGAQRHWVDATQIPYVVLSRSFINKFGVSAGDVALVFRPKTGKASFAVYGDGGKLGEASVRLHQDLGSNPIVTHSGIARAKRGIDDTIVTIVFPGYTTHPTVDAEKWRSEIERFGAKALAGWGGSDRVKACAN
jgi:Fungal chitosanase of glycosyl hydrolase group 75